MLTMVSCPGWSAEGEGYRQQLGHGGQRVTEIRANRVGHFWLLGRNTLVYSLLVVPTFWRNSLKYFPILNHVCKLVCLDLDTALKITHASGVELEGWQLIFPPFTFAHGYCLVMCTAPTPSFQVLSAVMLIQIQRLSLLKLCTWPGPPNTGLWVVQHEMLTATRRNDLQL